MMEYTEGEQKIDKILEEIDELNKLLPKLKTRVETLQSQNTDLYEALIKVRDNSVLQKQESGFYILRLDYATWQDICKLLAKVKGGK